MKFQKFAVPLALLPLIFSLTQCERLEGLFTDKPKKPGPYAFDVILKMSPKAEAALKQSPLGLHVNSWYFGDAAPAYRGQADDLNRIYLGQESWDYSGNSRHLHLLGEPIDISKLRQTLDREPKVFITVNRQGPPDDILSCHPYIGPIRLAQKTPQTLYCEFETEDYWDTVSSGSSSS